MSYTYSRTAFTFLTLALVAASFSFSVTYAEAKYEDPCGSGGRGGAGSSKESGITSSGGRGGASDSKQFVPNCATFGRGGGSTGIGANSSAQRSADITGSDESTVSSLESRLKSITALKARLEALLSQLKNGTTTRPENHEKGAPSDTQRCDRVQEAFGKGLLGKSSPSRDSSSIVNRLCNKDTATSTPNMKLVPNTLSKY
jgi:hypothetical protein